ncbi:MAG: hypothetical protein ACLS69_00770 [Butyricicoccus sp.]
MKKGKLLTGGTVDSTVCQLRAACDALGVNCGLGPKQMPRSSI